MKRDELNCVIVDKINYHFMEMCKEIDLIQFLDSKLKIPIELIDVVNNYESIKRRLKYQINKWPLPHAKPRKMKR